MSLPYAVVTYQWIILYRISAGLAVRLLSVLLITAFVVIWGINDEPY